MGIYYAAVDRQAKKRLESPEGYSIKSPGIYHPHNPFPHMVVMKNSQGWDFEIINDWGSGDAYYSSEYEDITEQVFKEYLDTFSWSKEQQRVKFKDRRT